MTIDIAALSDFSNPLESEHRFRDALAHASGDDARIIQTQIARTFGLRREFEKARELLRQIEPDLENSGAEVKVRYYLEFGRTYVSATHHPDELTAENKQKAAGLYLRSAEIAKDAQLDALAIDSLHMMAFVETEPATQMQWTHQALTIAESSNQPAAQKWEASLRNNIGYALHQDGELEAALNEFEQALVLREREGDPERIRIAKWMVAWTLRSLGRLDEALKIQLHLEEEHNAIGKADPHVFAELEQLYRAKGETVRAAHYAALQDK